ncbi:hypothetical protein C8J57DRAFT_1387574 [Mycena rebaudengoi]|nr:hypothetical protein C8J57DRAFT_1387574 [Mycena rebaudengoi]
MQHWAALCFLAVTTIQLFLAAGHDSGWLVDFSRPPPSYSTTLMAGRRSDKNSAPSASLSNARQKTIRRGSRLSKSVERVKKIGDTKAAKEKKLQQACRRQRALKQRQHDGALTVNRPDDTDELWELRAALARVQHERNAAEAAVTRTCRSIAPLNMSKITMEGIRNYLGLAHVRHDQKDIHRAISAERLYLSLNWKEHDHRRLARVYDMVEGAHPELRNFRAAFFLVQESYEQRKAYCAQVLATCMTLLERLEAMIVDSDDENPLFRLPCFYKETGTGLRAPSHSPNSSPSPPASPNHNGTVSNGALRGSDFITCSFDCNPGTRN